MQEEEGCARELTLPGVLKFSGKFRVALQVKKYIYGKKKYCK